MPRHLRPTVLQSRPLTAAPPFNTSLGTNIIAAVKANSDQTLLLTTGLPPTRRQTQPSRRQPTLPRQRAKGSIPAWPPLLTNAVGRSSHPPLQYTPIPGSVILSSVRIIPVSMSTGCSPPRTTDVILLYLSVYIVRWRCQVLFCASPLSVHRPCRAFPLDISLWFVQIL